jgi:catechol 2,3-dioxygenase-like lactoylglutathione lyase family enzyme
MPAIDHLARGTDHIAYPTFDPVATVRFYHDVLGFPFAHAITAKGWGQANHPDFVHFFFDIGNGDRLPFFYYFGLERRVDDTPYLLKHSARHLAIHVDDVDDLAEYDRRLSASEWPVHLRVKHETIESIYVIDPNDYLIEFTTPTRALTAADDRDGVLTVQALVDVVAANPGATLADLHARKAELVVAHAAEAVR